MCRRWRTTADVGSTSLTPPLLSEQGSGADRHSIVNSNTTRESVIPQPLMCRSTACDDDNPNVAQKR